jgi:transcriptional regulator with XRE-family HTH domain
MNFGARLKKARTHAGLSQKKLAELLGYEKDGSPRMSQANIGKLETNPKSHGSNYTYLIANICGVNPEWLTTGDGDWLGCIVVYDNTPEYQVLKAMQKMDELTKYQVVKIGNSLAEPEQDIEITIKPK